jgi:hypothetical protein
LLGDSTQPQLAKFAGRVLQVHTTLLSGEGISAVCSLTRVCGLAAGVAERTDAGEYLPRNPELTGEQAEAWRRSQR